MARLVFLPGMSGNADFWRPVADALTAHEAEFVNWPGLGDNPPDPDVHSYDDLVSLVVDRLDRPSVLVAQSMGGYVAVRAAAVARDRVTHLVLAVTSGGVDLTRFGAEDWRPGSRAAHPSAPEWAFAPTDDLSHVIRTIDVPVLLVWATHDPISPLAVGEHLAGLFPNAQLVAFDSDDHWVARAHATDVAREIAALLSR
jgi:pimeloyl-ACP methyl ester carboxylesterase